MEPELSALEEKVRLAADLCQRLREENLDLRQRMAQLANENKRLEDKVSGARTRLESLLTRMPE